MTPAEVEFLAENEPITVEPTFSQNTIHLISGDVGPFNPQVPMQVPLWMALNLKDRQKCNIRVPDWMDIEELERKKQEEMDSAYFTSMPNTHYMEITQLLLKSATEDIPGADEVRTLVKDIWDIRMAKLRSSVDQFVKSDVTHAKLSHLTLMELNTMRRLLTDSMDHLHTLRSNMAAGATQRAQRGADY